MNAINHIVIIDDNKIDLFINQKICSLAFEKASIRTFHNSQMALDYFKNPTDKCDIILLDINMPIINGFDFLKNINQTDWFSKHHVEVYFLSSSNLVSDINEAFSISSCSGYIEKPLTKDKLINALRLNDSKSFVMQINNNKLKINSSNDVA